MVVPKITKINSLRCHIQDDTAYFRLHCTTENQSPFRLTIDSVYVLLQFSNQEVVNEKQWVGIRQEPGQMDSLIVPLKVPLKKTIREIKSLQGKDSTDLVLHASLVYNTMAGKQKLNLDQDFKIEVPVPVQFKIIGTKTEKVRFLKKEAEVDLFLQIKNPGHHLKVDISDLQYQLRIGDELSEVGKHDRRINIDPQSYQIVQFHLDFDLNHPLKTARKILTDNDVEPYHLKLEGLLHLKNFPPIPTTLTTQGQLELRNEEKRKAQKKKIKELEKRR